MPHPPKKKPYNVFLVEGPKIQIDKMRGIFTRWFVTNQILQFLFLTTEHGKLTFKRVINNIKQQVPRNEKINDKQCLILRGKNIDVLLNFILLQLLTRWLGGYEVC